MAFQLRPALAPRKNSRRNPGRPSIEGGSWGLSQGACLELEGCALVLRHPFDIGTLRIDRSPAITALANQKPQVDGAHSTRVQPLRLVPCHRLSLLPSTTTTTTTPPPPPPAANHPARNNQTDCRPSREAKVIARGVSDRATAQRIWIQHDISNRDSSGAEARHWFIVAPHWPLGDRFAPPPMPSRYSVSSEAAGLAANEIGGK